MSKYFKLVAPNDPGNNNSESYVFERDEDGTVTGEAKVGVPVQIGAEDKKKLEALGAVFEDSSAEESKEFEAEAEANQVGTDIAGSAPVFDQAPSPKASTETATPAQSAAPARGNS